MGYKTLITLNGTAPYDDLKYEFDVTPGGALEITKANGAVDLIGPGFWVAVVEDDSNVLDWEFLAPQPADDTVE
jgi:hypothetical protein